MNLPDHDLLLRIEQKTLRLNRQDAAAVNVVVRQYCAAVHSLKLLTDLLEGFVKGRITAKQVAETKR